MCAKQLFLPVSPFKPFFFNLFVICNIVFHRRPSRLPTTMSVRLDEEQVKIKWRDITRVLFVASALVFVRFIFRFVEFTGGMILSTLRT
jgi:hypothetical protein